MRKICIIGAITCMFAACKPSVNINAPVSAGTVVFQNYLAIGSSYTAGFADSSLTVSSQLNSYPERLFEQFTLPGGNNGANGPFVQPLLTSDNGYPYPKLILGTLLDTCAGTTSLGPIPYPGFVQAPADATLYVSPDNNGQINNIGVPYLRVADYVVGNYTAINSYAARFYKNIAGTIGSPMDELSWDVSNLYPTFFTFWLGEEDILGYALAGGQGNGTGYALPLSGAIYNLNDITPTVAFEKIYDSALSVAMRTGASGALVNIPDITELPFLTTIPANGLFITTQKTADSLTTLWQTDFPNIVFQIGYNYFIIKDNAGNVRQAVPGEEILLTTPLNELQCHGWGSTTPIPEKYVLTTDEEQNIRAATTTFNAFIFQESEKYHLAYVDMHAYFQSLYTGFAYNGVNYNAKFVTGGAFSLDGIALTQRGYALAANNIISTINTFYHSTLPLTDVNKYNGILFPN